LVSPLFTYKVESDGYLFILYFIVKNKGKHNFKTNTELFGTFLAVHQTCQTVGPHAACNCRILCCCPIRTFIL